MESFSRPEKCDITNAMVSKLLGFLQIFIAISVIVAGALVLLRATSIHVDIGEAIIALVRLGLGGLLILSAIIWAVASFFPKSRAMNGTNLGFAILSLLAALALFSVNCVAMQFLTRCQEQNYRCRADSGAKKALHSSLLFISIVSTILALLDVIICSRKCCCTNVGFSTEHGQTASAYAIQLMSSAEGEAKVSLQGKDI